MNKIVQVKTGAFVLAVLYNGAKPKMKEDAKHAAKCLDSLKPEQRPTIPLSDVPNYDEKTGFDGLKPKPSRAEHEMYVSYVSLLNHVGWFFRNSTKDVDGAWLAAQPPTAGTASQNAGPPLQRVFRDTHNNPRSFSRYKEGLAGLKPDLCLLIEPKESEGEPLESEGEPVESEDEPVEPEDESMESEDETEDESEDESMDETEDESEDEYVDSESEAVESEGEPEVPAHWKDVLVPFELKKRKNMDVATLAQVSQYAQSLMLEQYDRNFVFTVLISGTQCRVFHWDVAGAQVMVPFDIHKKPKLFLQVMGRLATMTPSELGYDIHFSNAGRVLSSQADIKTHLTIHPSIPRPFLNHADKSPTTECSNKKTLILELKEMQFEAKGPLFTRATRVWRAVATNDPQATYIVKQNWADDRRPNEGFFHHVARNVNEVPKLVSMEEREFTSSFRARFDSNLTLPISKADDTKGANEKPLERVLLRFVFDREGRSLSKATDSAELLQATVQWIDGLIALDNCGIIHRDISHGNLLLPFTSDGRGTGQASIIDLGLSHFKDNAKTIKEFAPGEDYSARTFDQAVLGSFQPQPHRHLTGTLPFVAYELLKSFHNSAQCQHGLHHDVESVFWVLLYVCLKGRGTKMDTKFADMLRDLTSSDVNTVKNQKLTCLLEEDIFKGIGGTFGDLEGFLGGFAAIHLDYGKQPVFASEVRNLAFRELKKIRGSPVTSPVTSPATRDNKREFEQDSLDSIHALSQYERQLKAPKADA
ncbi:hypothetical protein FRC01_007100 [Tulasnella sp. 417]|nr:hypothetical protein FRC01_007100 [Tulasnella sp. 417]